jgi:hypothetical protein
MPASCPCLPGHGQCYTELGVLAPTGGIKRRSCLLWYLPESYLLVVTLVIFCLREDLRSPFRTRGRSAVAACCGRRLEV